MAVGNPLVDLFGKSPVRPIQEHMQKVQASTRLLQSFVAAAQKNDWKKANAIQKEIVGLEREADKLKHSVRTHLPKRMFMPVSRNDLLELVTTQDRIAGSAKDIAGLMVGRKISFPKPLYTQMKEYLEVCIEVSAQALQAINEMDEVFEAGFGRREMRKVDAKIKEIGRLEKRTDKLQIKVRAALFKLETDLPPVEVMFLYKIIELIGDIADHAERTGNRMQILITQ
jgi:predicted phosphate transport protein (TIGR00153 family)